MWTQPMSKTLGVVTEAPMDWTHSELLPVFSCAAVVLGTTTHFFGEWVRSVGLGPIYTTDFSIHSALPPMPFEFFEGREGRPSNCWDGGKCLLEWCSADDCSWRRITCTAARLSWLRGIGWRWMGPALPHSRGELLLMISKV